MMLHIKRLQPIRNRMEYYGKYYPMSIVVAGQVIGWSLAIPAIVAGVLHHPYIAVFFIVLLASVIVFGLLFLVFMTIVTRKEEKQFEKY